VIKALKLISLWDREMKDIKRIFVFASLFLPFLSAGAFGEQKIVINSRQHSKPRRLPGLYQTNGAVEVIAEKFRITLELLLTI
jgi:hypothetical protein